MRAMLACFATFLLLNSGQFAASVRGVLAYIVDAPFQAVGGRGYHIPSSKSPAKATCLDNVRREGASPDLGWAP